MAGTQVTAEFLRTRLPAGPELESIPFLNRVLRVMAQWRGTLLGNTFAHHHGLTIYSGPFKGMEYLNYSTEGCLLPRLLGTYEAELHPELLKFVDEGIDTVVDIGCAEGYYAVGLARLMPEATVYAFDTNPRAREACLGLAQKNQVEARVVIEGTFTGEMFERFVGGRTLVMIDAEGFEEELMKPELWPALRSLNIIMETHPGLHPGIEATMRARFEPSHDIVRLATGPRSADLPPWLLQQPHLDQLIALWEFRASPTPWFVMRPKSLG